MSQPKTHHLLLPLALGLLWLSASTQPTLNKIKQQQQLTTAIDPLENAPPDVAFATVALGGFRGLIADYLWLRAMRLQVESKYFEAVQLADWITKLQPRFTAVWRFQSWNMAWNISVEFPEFSDRWHWIVRGMELIRDEGLVMNPSDVDMYYELAWIFLDKIGSETDKGNRYFKLQWAQEMMQLFDGEHPDYDAFAAAPKTVEALRADPAVAALLDRLLELGVDLANDYFLFYRGYLEMPEAAEKIITDEANKAVMDKISLFARARALREHYKIDLQRMRELDEVAGGLDWRSPDAHALYWAKLGQRFLPPNPDQAQLDNTDRAIYHALMRNFNQGRLIITPDGSMITTPNTNVVPMVHDYFVNLTKTSENDPNVIFAHASFLREAVYLLYTFNRRALAVKWFKVLQEVSPPYKELATIEEFVVQEGRMRVEGGTSRVDAINLVESNLLQSFVFLASGDYEQSAGLEKVAKLTWKDHQRHWDGNPGRLMPPYEQIKSQVLKDCLTNFPEVMRQRLRSELGLPPEQPESKPETETES